MRNMNKQYAKRAVGSRISSQWMIGVLGPFSILKLYKKEEADVAAGRLHEKDL